MEPLSFQKAIVHPLHDRKRLGEGKDLNDALLDFFVKLGQSLIPENCQPPVAYLGSHFYDVLRKGGAKDGFEGHQNVANWARRRLGKDGLFSSGIGALAVPVNETLTTNGYDGRQQETQEKHWWLALLLNPQAATGAADGVDKDCSMLCLDSFVRAETKFDPPVRALRNGNMDGYPVEVSGLCRIGFNIKVYLNAKGDGSAGALPDPKDTKLRAGGRVFSNSEAELKVRDLGSNERPGNLEGALGFRLDRRGAAKTVGQYNLEFGDRSDKYDPPMKLRMGEKPTECQFQVAQFLGGYLDKEHEGNSNGNHLYSQGPKRVETSIRLPGVPQQETSHDCGFFIMEMILRTLQLSPKALRELATASSVEIAMLPWPSQKQIVRRKAMLREVIDTLFAAAKQHDVSDVEKLFQIQPDLKKQVRSALVDGGPNFDHGYDRWAAGDWDLSPSPSRSTSRPRPKGSKDRSGYKSEKRSSRKRSTSTRSDRGRRKRKKRRRRNSSSDSADRRRRRRRRSRSSTRSRSEKSSSESRSESAVIPEKKTEEKQESFTMQDLDTLPVSKLRKFCEQRNSLPPGMLERSDLVKALSRFAVPVQPGTQRLHVAKVPVPATVPGMAVGRFTRAVLEAMTTKDLRTTCVQKNVLPPPPLERTDLIQALVPFAAPV